MSSLSMTGYGRGTATVGDFSAEAEISTVNRKQFDCSVALPQGLSALDEPCRRAVRARLTRGHAQVTIRVSATGSATGSAAVAPLVAERIAQIKALAAAAGVPFELSLRDLVRMPDLLAAASPAPDPEVAAPAVMAALQTALDSHSTMRRREGEALRADLEARLDRLAEIRNAMAARAPLVPAAHRDALRRRIAELGSPLPPDDPSLAREIAIVADKCDVSEELTRLAAHIDHARALLAAPDEPAGRKLDFLAQEMNRECNTIGSKASDSEIAAAVVNAKAIVETFREQVQNLE